MLDASDLGEIDWFTTHLKVSPSCAAAIFGGCFYFLEWLEISWKVNLELYDYYSIVFVEEEDCNIPNA